MTREPWTQHPDVAERGRRWLAGQLERCAREYSGADGLDESERVVLKFLAGDAPARGVVQVPDAVLGAATGYSPADVRRVLEWLAWRGCVAVNRLPATRPGQRVAPLVVSLRGWADA